MCETRFAVMILNLIFIVTASLQPQWNLLRSILTAALLHWRFMSFRLLSILRRGECFILLCFIPIFRATATVEETSCVEWHQRCEFIVTNEKWWLNARLQDGHTGLEMLRTYINVHLKRSYPQDYVAPQRSAAGETRHIPTCKHSMNIETKFEINSHSQSNMQLIQGTAVIQVVQLTDKTIKTSRKK